MVVQARLKRARPACHNPAMAGEHGVGRPRAGQASPMPAPQIPLPEGLANPREAARVTFDGCADLYDVARPGYPARAMEDLRSRCAITTASTVLEIGCGTGQASASLARLGCRLRCLEPGPRLAALARHNLAAYPGVVVEETTFEEAVADPGSYDAVISATAFHWVDPRVGFPKAARLLRPGGGIALLTNVHAQGGSHRLLAPRLRPLHRTFAPEVGDWDFPPARQVCASAEAPGDIATVWSRIERKFTEPPAVDDLFEPPVVSTYPWVATYDRRSFVAMLSTQSTYALLEENRREALLTGIGAAVDEVLGGTVTKEYVTILATACSRR